MRIPFHSLSLSKTIPDKDHPPYLDILHGSDSTPTQALQLLDSLPEHGLSIVGTRYPQRRSVELMERTFLDLKNFKTPDGKKLVIISGFARGIDSCAHELALECGLKTIAILGCGIDVDYPRENRHLKRRILESGGLIISEFHAEALAFAGNFLKRNRLISAMGKAVWVVEAAAISGTLNTAGWACKHNRDLYATPCFPGDIFYQGNEKLLNEKNTHSYPIAKTFFGAFSLGDTWSALAPKHSTPSFNLQNLKTPLQQWVATLAQSQGFCSIQSLMNVSTQNGLTPGQFYLEFEKETLAGNLIYHPDGKVSISARLVASSA